MTNEDKLREIFPKTIFLQHKEGDKITALVCSDEWLNAEYQEPTTKNDVPDINVGKIDRPSVTPQFSSGLEKNSQKLENSTKKYCGCCKHWKRKGVKKIGDKPTSYGKCTKLSISGFDVETTFNDNCSSEGLE